jgi:hypothetical protein
MATKTIEVLGNGSPIYVSVDSANGESIRIRLTRTQAVTLRDKLETRLWLTSSHKHSGTRRPA